jgi:hypothetical protein
MHEADLMEGSEGSHEPFTESTSPLSAARVNSPQRELSNNTL